MHTRHLEHKMKEVPPLKLLCTGIFTPVSTLFSPLILRVKENTPPNIPSLWGFWCYPCRIKSIQGWVDWDNSVRSGFNVVMEDEFFWLLSCRSSTRHAADGQQNCIGAAVSGTNYYRGSNCQIHAGWSSRGWLRWKVVERRRRHQCTRSGTNCTTTASRLKILFSTSHCDRWIGSQVKKRFMGQLYLLKSIRT